MNAMPLIPQTITIHLGAATDSSATDWTLPYLDYIKQTASFLLLPTWPENAIRAGVYAILSSVLSRVSSRVYRKNGYPFDLTSSPREGDLAFEPQGAVYEPVVRVADELKLTYLKRPGSNEPLFVPLASNEAEDGLVPARFVALAADGLSAYDILIQFLGKELQIARGVKSASPPPQNPGETILPGEEGATILALQIRLNRISAQVPTIPKIFPIDGVFGEDMQRAVLAFQEHVSLPQTGFVDSGTFEAITSLYLAIVSLERCRLETPPPFEATLRAGQTDPLTPAVRDRLCLLSCFRRDVLPPPEPSQYYSEELAASVRSFQRAFGLPVTGAVDLGTWSAIEEEAARLADHTASDAFYTPRSVLSEGACGVDVMWLQTYLNELARTYPDIGYHPVNGYFDRRLSEAVRTFAFRCGLRPEGMMSAALWDTLLTHLSDLRRGAVSSPGQYPGYAMQERR